MHAMFDEHEDVLLVRLSTKPVEREVVQENNVQLGYAADGTLAELLVLDARASGMMPIERVPTQAIPRGARPAARVAASALRH